MRPTATEPLWDKPHERTRSSTRRRTLSVVAGLLVGFSTVIGGVGQRPGSATTAQTTPSTTAPVAPT
ncbi:MAG: hypothetical protein WBM50_12155, partial [Acidimicrobiales bacterium]